VFFDLFAEFGKMVGTVGKLVEVVKTYLFKDFNTFFLRLWWNFLSLVGFLRLEVVFSGIWLKVRGKSVDMLMLR
jgi:hypothetical protein